MAKRDTDAYIERIRRDELDAAIAALELELNWFEWRSPHYGSICGGDIVIDDDKLAMTVWTADNDESLDTDPPLRPLKISTPIMLDLSARDQIRALIHAWLCHEADEQLYFGEQSERLYYPAHPTDVRTVDL